MDKSWELRREASQRGWWSTARLPEWLAAYVGLEADATSLRCLALELIPGLLQTEDYAREIHLLGDHMTAPDKVGRWVAARVQRQHRLTGPQPLRLSAVRRPRHRRSVIVARLDRLFAALRDQALGADESLVVISELLSTTG